MTKTMTPSAATWMSGSESRKRPTRSGTTGEGRRADDKIGMHDGLMAW